jgi:hypothetical protein
MLKRNGVNDAGRKKQACWSQYAALADTFEAAPSEVFWTGRRLG